MRSMCVSAYADDVDIFITNNCFEHIDYCIDIYSESSNAKINYSKSCGLWCGSWKSRTDKPLNLNWRNTGCTFLGVKLGNSCLFVEDN